MLVILAVFSLAAICAASNPPVVDAAKAGDKQALRSLIEKKADVNAAAPDGTTALHWAGYNDDAESAGLLIRAGGRVNAATDLGVTPLWLAAENASARMTATLLEAGANPNAALLKGETPLMTAARAGNAEVVSLLVAKGANVNARAARGQTALMWAVAQKHAAVVQVLLDSGADVHARSEAWSQMMAVPPHGHPANNRQVPHGSGTALLFAARVGDLASAKLLLAAGANVNDADAWGVSATVLAAHSGYQQMVAYFLEKGADPNAAAAGFTALHVAILRRDEKMALALLAHGADPNAPLRVWTPTRRSSNDFHFPPALVGATPFWLAARFRLPEVMRQLVKRGADPLFVHRAEYVIGDSMQRTTEVTTSLMAATGMGGGKAWVSGGAGETETLEAVRLACELGVDVNAKNARGQTALGEARASGYESVVRFLLSKGAR
jgi:ankyrin repeat protein